MAGSVNKVILIGNLGKDPEIRYLENGTAVARFPIATSESYIDKTTGEKRDITDWHNIVLWRGLASISEKYLKKGMKVYIEGKLKTRQWQDSATNQTKYTTEVIADNMTMLSRVDNPNKPYPSSTENQQIKPVDEIKNDDKDDLPF
jgi:single-strand DNA-binding protein